MTTSNQEVESLQAQLENPLWVQNLVAVKPERDRNNEEYRRINWWLFGRRNSDTRGFLKGLPRYIATVETMQHRIFMFLDDTILPDNRLVAIGSQDAFHLGVLSSSIHVRWSLATGGTLEDRPIYTKSICFDRFPFPDVTDTQKSAIRAIAEELDAHRKRVLAAHPHLTLTGLYNVLEKVRVPSLPLAGRVQPEGRREGGGDGPPSRPADAVHPPRKGEGGVLNTLSPEERRIFDDGLVLILKEHHNALDAAVADAYGWPVDLPEEEVLAKLVALNHARAKDEAAGIVKWLRPEFQIPRFGSTKDKAELQLVGGEGDGMVETIAAAQKPLFPTDDFGQMAAVMAVMAGMVNAGVAPDATSIAATFRQGQRIQPRVVAALNAIARSAWTASSDGGKTFSMRRVA